MAKKTVETLIFETWSTVPYDQPTSRLEIQTNDTVKFRQVRAGIAIDYDNGDRRFIPWGRVYEWSFRDNPDA